MALSKGSARLGAYLPEEGSRAGSRNLVGFKKFRWTKSKKGGDSVSESYTVVRTL
jgi:hypothetical protein